MHSSLYPICATLLLATSLAAAQSGPDQTEAERLLTARSAEFAQDLIKVTDGVYTAVGFGVSPSTMIVGQSGLVIIDTQIDEAAATEVLSAFRTISDKPVKGIVFTHGHGDHTGGAGVFIREAEAAGYQVELWAHPQFGEESLWIGGAGLSVQRMRGARQGGFLLAPEQRINNGVAQAYWPKLSGGVFGARNNPTHLLASAREKVVIAGIELDLVVADGETADQIYVWYGAQKVLFAGDNFYKSWPNLYAIRGTGYRDIKAWAASVNAMLNEGPHHLVGGHTRPILGEENVREVLTNYRDAILSIFDQTIAGMNKGLTPDQLVEVVKLPQRFAELDYLREYYGNIEWAVRAIFSGYLGWFDGNPSSLFPLSPKDEAQRLADLAGGVERLWSTAEQVLDNDPQWTAQLCDHLLALDSKNTAAMLLKAEALEALARELLTATGRNYYNTVALQLRMRAQGKGIEPPGQKRPLATQSSTPHMISPTLRMPNE